MNIFVNIITAPLTNHSAVSIFIPLHLANIKIRTGSYWKHEAMKIEIQNSMTM